MTPMPQTRPDDPSHLPRAEFAFPGPLRDQLVAAILDGSKTRFRLVTDLRPGAGPVQGRPVLRTVEAAGPPTRRP